MIHIAKPDMTADEVESETTEKLESAEKYANILSYNKTHKRKKPYPK